MKLRDNFHLFAATTILFWSLAYVMTRLALGYFSPFSLGFFRYFIASIVLLFIAIIIKINIPAKNDIKWFIFAGFFGFFFYMIVFNIGSITVPASTSSIIIATTPIITTLLARIFFKEKLKVIQYIAIIIQFMGVGILTLMNGIFSINKGLIWIILASISLSIYNLLQRKITQKYSAIQSVIISIWFGTIMLFIFLPNSIGEIKNVTIIPIIYLTILGVFSSAVAYITWTYALKIAKNTSYVTNYMFLTPFIATIFGILLAKEIPDIYTIIGGIIIILGMVIFNFSDIIMNKYRSRNNCT